MRISESMWLGCLLVFGAPIASAQTNIDRSFTVKSKTCDGIQWSDEALERYPTIGSACQAIEERGGKTYVRFEGKVKRNVDRGEQLVMDFKGGGDVTVTPPPDMLLYIDGRRTPVAKVQRGDELTFYVAEDRLAAHFPETESVTARFVVVPITQPEEPMAEELPQQTASLPATAGWLPLLALVGFAMLGTGAVVTLFRWRAR